MDEIKRIENNIKTLNEIINHSASKYCDETTLKALMVEKANYEQQLSALKLILNIN